MRFEVGPSPRTILWFWVLFPTKYLKSKAIWGGDTDLCLLGQRGLFRFFKHCLGHIAAIADEFGLTKQALLHHFGSKEKLHGEVLKRISSRFDAIEREPDTLPEDAASMLKTYLLRLRDSREERSERTHLLVRELLDNKRRADAAGTWYLKSFLERLVAMVQAILDAVFPLQFARLIDAAPASRA